MGSFAWMELISDQITADWVIKAKSQRSYLSYEICTFFILDFFVCVLVCISDIGCCTVAVIFSGLFLENKYAAF